MIPRRSPESRKKLLIVDDDPELRQLLAAYFQRHGYDALQLPDARQVDAYLARYQPHLLILDLMMPGEDGLALCQRLREQGETVPVVMLTARDETRDRITGLRAGADDYLGKPFDPQELLARVEAVLRRQAPLPAAPLPEAAVVACGSFAFDRRTRELRRGDEVTALSSAEFALLNALVSNPNRPLRRERLRELSQGDDRSTDERSVDVQVFRLRRLIEADPRQPRLIQTVWGVGYVYVPGAEAAPAP